MTGKTCTYRGCVSQPHHRGGLCKRHHRAVVTGRPANPPKRPGTPEKIAARVERARELRADGWSLSEIARELDCSKWTVARDLDEKEPAPVRSNSKITDSILQEFEFLTSFGTTPERVAARLGVPLNSIRKAQDRTTERTTLC